MKKKQGNCYVTCEALFHLLGGKEAGLTPYYLKHEGVTHWYLVKRTPMCKHILDPTVKQFKNPPDYCTGKGCGFLTKKPSKRAKKLIKELLWKQ